MVKKIVLIVLGLVALISGLFITAVGVASLALGGRSGTIQSGYHHIDTTTTAFVTDPAHIRDSTNVQLHAGTATLRVAAQETPKDLFIGVGPADQVTAYLAGSPYDEITDLNFAPFKLTTSTVTGTATPAAPADQTFWVARATGPRPSLNWDISSGDYRLVVMNTDGSPGVAADVRVGLKIPALFGIGLGATIAGGLLSLIGLLLLIWGIAARRKRGAPVPAYPGVSYPPATPYTPTGGSGPYPPTYSSTTPDTYPGTGPAGPIGPGYRSPTYRPSSDQPPSDQPPGYQAPGYQAPGYQAPGYQAPDYQAPGYQAPGYGADPAARPTSGTPSDGSEGGWPPPR